jgi:hypothetical protein
VRNAGHLDSIRYFLSAGALLCTMLLSCCYLDSGGDAVDVFEKPM